MSLEQLMDDFTLLEDWEDRYRYLIDLGSSLAPLSVGERSRANKVSGCVSQVWLVKEERGDRLIFRGTSDAHIVRGLIALLLTIYSDKPSAEIGATDAGIIFEKLGLSDHLSPQRSSGFYAMVARIKSYAHLHQVSGGKTLPAG